MKRITTVGFVLATALLAVGITTVRAASADPVHSLRDE